jgi:hypothetical protein
MDSVLKHFNYDTIFEYDQRIIDLLCLYGVEHTIDADGPIICCRNKSLLVNIFLSNNVEFFSELSDIVKDGGYRRFYGSHSYYYEIFSTAIFCFGNVEMVEYLSNKIDLLILPKYCFEYLAYRLDDNVEIVDTVSKKVTGNIPYARIACSAAYANNINIFKYIYDFTLIDGYPQIKFFNAIKNVLIWKKSSIEFLEFFLIKSLLSEKDIINGVKIVKAKNKIDLVLSYVDSGRLKLSSKTVDLLNKSIDNHK